ncbi:hypothetical protein [Flavobacterium sp. MK4S-17]|uniref:hypothetical protein n=1 Tax=Flavobacterium sp. MK4S-17 TaxID=2543737 RepID=UPI00135A99F6|nr:hypothetical protein [Flavobacterium sp. MK4S-17]
MKKIFLLIAAMAFLSGCDDGEMTFKTFDFSGANAQRCSDNNLIYKINGTEVLILDIDPSYLVNIPTPEGSPRVVTITTTGTNKIVYRNYSSSLSSNTICSELPPSSPTVRDEWKGDGTVNIITTPKFTDGKLSAYIHTIRLVDVSFNKDGETIRIVDNSFGEVNSPLGYTFNFNDDANPTPVQRCSQNMMIYKINQSEALMVDIDLSIFNNGVGGPYEVDLSITTDNNEIIFDKYNGSVTTGNICDVVKPITPVVINRWYAVSGTLKVITENDPVSGGVLHKIYFANTVFQNNNGETILIGDTEDYFFGLYTN